MSLFLLIIYFGFVANASTTTHHLSTAGLREPRKTFYAVSPRPNENTPTNNPLKLMYPFFRDKTNKKDMDLTREVFVTEISAIKIPLDRLQDFNFREKVDDGGEEEDGYSRDFNDNDYVNEDYVQKKRPNYDDYPSSIDSDNYPEIVSRYKVVEKIPDDTKYVRPKEKVVPIPPPCIRTPPRPRPNTPRPPSIKSFRPLTNHFSFTDGIQLPSKYFQDEPQFRKRINSYPYIIKKYSSGSEPSNVIIRQRGGPSKGLRDVHIHHYHPTPIPMDMHIHKSHEDEIDAAQRKRLEMVVRNMRSSKMIS